ncbi:MAG TPA: methyltransferase domain-containing protein [Solirubrobacteraceae bacterium]
MQDETLQAEFTHQAETFNRSAVAHAADTLEALVELAAPGPSERWLDVACGPGIISRALAAGAGAVHGVDLTEAMVDVARREASAAGLANTTFACGDATALELADASFDGAVARFTIHHLPAPARLLEELARVVRPGGRIVIADHIADDDAADAAWALELERLRDPSHWAALRPERLRALGVDAGLELASEAIAAISLDFDDWLARGSGGARNAALIERVLSERTGGSERFRVSREGGSRVLQLQLWLALWRR